jgi:muramoyltetrapeptide carboxypeptidase LdcA involved in peptidoglycan recycling
MVDHASPRKVAVLSPSRAAPAMGPAVHEQAMCRLRGEFGLEPVEYPTTRVPDSAPEDRARDIMAAFTDPEITAVFATLGGDDQVTVIPFLDPGLIRANPKPFFGYSDNTNMLNLLHSLGVPAFHGGNTQVQIGAGPGLDDILRTSLTAALTAGGLLEVTDPGQSEDHGIRWRDPLALTENGPRESTPPWRWAGAARKVSGRSWGGCLEVITQMSLADRMPRVEDLAGGILMIEASARLTNTHGIMEIVRALGEADILSAVEGVMMARPPARSLFLPGYRDREEIYDAVIGQVELYNPEAVVVCGVPFGHTRPQWILPYGGTIVLDGVEERIFAVY